MSNGRTYAVPAEDIKKYVDQAIAQLGLDPVFVDDMDSAMYAHHLVYHSENASVAREVFNMPEASISELARKMADADGETITKIEKDERYQLPPPSYR
ncbi:MAG: hypothetical protein IPK84_03500 [Candidatus Moraniibacteriota bacterium]|nr:MAG: hypothetical protein IPK84_03500 [Candidatus Moranbacteria bacterium]